MLRTENKAFNTDIENKQINPSSCPHAKLRSPQGVALIAIGNTLRTDDGVASVLCRNLPAKILNKVCFFDLGTFTAQLAQCLLLHKAAIIIDCMRGTTAPGTATIFDLHKTLNSLSPSSINSSHGFSFIDELMLQVKKKNMPEQMFFVGIEAASSDWGEGLSAELQEQLPKLEHAIYSLIESTLEAIEVNA